jgi:flagellar biosynthesis protein FlhA
MKLLNHVVSLFVILIIALIIIPLPASLLDMMFIINISLSLVILLLTMYIKQALDFSVFPSILLITTLFRLALNISSTRLILSHSGEAGQVIKTFGSFVLQGNIVVGFVVFLIIVLVQLCSFWLSQKVQNVFQKWQQDSAWMLCPVSRWLLMRI